MGLVVAHIPRITPGSGRRSLGEYIEEGQRWALKHKLGPLPYELAGEVAHTLELVGDNPELVELTRAKLKGLTVNEPADDVELENTPVNDTERVEKRGPWKRGHGWLAP